MTQTLNAGRNASRHLAILGIKHCLEDHVLGLATIHNGCSKSLLQRSSMGTNPEAFLLITLENTTLKTGRTIQTGILGLECVTFPVNNQRDVFLVLRLNDIELPIEHERHITLDTSSQNVRTYTLLPTQSDPNTIILDVQTAWHPSFLEDVETFDGILAQYTQFSHSRNTELPVPAYVSSVGDEKSRDLNNYRGQLVLVNEDSGEVVGEFDRKINIREDPTLRERGHENDPVVIQAPDGKQQNLGDESPLEFFASVVPPDQQNWITTSATVVSHAITAGTSLFISVLTGASQMYIKHSEPSPHHPTNVAKAAGPPKPLPRALVFLTSDKTKDNLSTVHAYSGKAVQVSGKTISIINGMIKKTMGSDKKGKGRAVTVPVGRGYQQEKQSAPPPALPPNKPISPTASHTWPPPGAPPPYYASTSGHLTPGSKPPLPPRHSPSPSRAPSPSPSPSPSLAAPALPPRKLSTTKRILLSADLILSTIDVSTKRALEAGTSRVGAVVGHKYGDTAGRNAEMMMGTTRNVALVYVDLQGIGRKAILRTAGREFVKGRLRSSK